VGRMLRPAPSQLGALLLMLLVTCSHAAAATRHAPTLAPAPTVIDGPSANILALSGLAIARDGTGTVVYLKTASGVAHVFASSLLNGRFGAPVQVDTGLAGASSQPVVAATNQGLTLVAFINGGELYTVERPSALAAWQAPVPLFTGASNPSLSMSPFGKAYLAFTGAGAGGHDVRVAYFNLGQWTLAPTSLDVNPSDDAGTGTGRPQVATASDGTGIVAWGENGHIYTRQVLGTSPSVVVSLVDPPSVSGWSEVSADEPVIATGGDSAYASVAFHEVVTDGVSQQSRVLDNRWHAAFYDGAKPADGLSTPGPEGAQAAGVAVAEYGTGLVTAEREQSNNVFVSTLGENESLGPPAQLNTMFQQSAADAVPATAGTASLFVAWQQDPGSVGTPEIRVRYAPNGTDLGSEVVVSTPDLGPTNAARGLAAGGDVAGDAAVAWVQGSGAQTQIVANQLFQPPRVFGPFVLSRYATSVSPVLTWSAASELWGAAQYIVKLDGVQIADTTATRIRTPAPVAQGRHSWQVTAVNLGGVATVARASTVFVDSVPPKVSVKITGPRHVHSELHLTVSYTDAPRGVPRSAASGVRSVQVKWGDGSKYSIRHGKHHIYSRRGTYVVTVTVSDRAGNKTIVTRKLKITPTLRTRHGRRAHRR
jgi:hypothetical protein